MTSNNGRTELFFEEAKELLEKVEQQLLSLDKSSNTDSTVVNEIFRHIHSIKGGADFLGLAKIKELSHATEDALGRVRNKDSSLTPDDISTLLVVTDYLKEMLNDRNNSQNFDTSHLLKDIERISVLEVNNNFKSQSVEMDITDIGTFTSPGLFQVPTKKLNSFHQDGFNLFILELKDSNTAKDIGELENVLSNLVSIGYILDSKAFKQEAEPSGEPPSKDNLLHILFRSVLPRTAILRYLNLDAKSLIEFKDPSVNITDSEARDEEFALALVPDRRQERRYDRRRDERRDENAISERRSQDFSAEKVVKDNRTFTRDEIDLSTMNDSSETETDDKKRRSSQSVRVSVDILDDLMNLVGELVLTRNQLKQNLESNDRIGTTLTAQRLDIVTSELQESVMSTRMQPLGNILTKFHRIIRTMSNQLGKSVNLILEGEDVELDKSIIENISDPLTHLVRNAIDHGIETPDVRHAKNKPVNATLAITAKQEAGHVVIEIKDDGQGIDSNKVKKVAIKQGLIDEERADEITEKELLKLIFAPGFSTAQAITDISGRGVGLDVVFTNITKLGGAVDVDSSPNVGTIFKVTLPLTLAIVPSLLVSSGGDTFAIPQINLVELVRIPANQRDRRIEYLGDAAVIRLRDRLLPIVWLDTVLNLDTSQRTEDGSTNIVVVNAGEFYYGIVVNHFTDSEEIVVKPLGVHLKDCKCYASATILGDGNAALILDIKGIAQTVNISQLNELTDADKKEREHDRLLSEAQEKAGQEQSLLIVENGNEEYIGIELAYINRIERIRFETIEDIAHKHMIKYRGGVLRIFKLNEALDSIAAPREADYVYLIVFYMMGTEVAIMVSDIVDIVDADMTSDNSTLQSNGVIGTSIISDRITLLVDIFEMVKIIDPTMVPDDIRHSANELLANKDTQSTVLIVEDSVFFQDKLIALMEDMDVKVLLAEDGKIGWDILNKNPQQVDLVLTDIEMPNMNGLELSRQIRGDKRTNKIPIIMLTSLAKDSDIEIGKKAGANEYLIKMDQEIVRYTINRYLDKKTVRKAG